MDLGAKWNRGIKPDAQAFDEVRIVTVPRYKTSGLSGDEWRISASMQFFRKGKMVHEKSVRDVKVACAMVAAEYYHAIDDGKGFYAGEESKCDQEGCSEEATVTYMVKEEFAKEDPHQWHRPPIFKTYRRFCAKHSRRGDYGFDDSDANYKLIDGSIAEPEAKDVSPSGFGGVIEVN